MDLWGWFEEYDGLVLLMGLWYLVVRLTGWSAHMFGGVGGRVRGFTRESHVPPNI